MHWLSVCVRARVFALMCVCVSAKQGEGLYLWRWMSHLFCSLSSECGLFIDQDNLLIRIIY